MNSDSFIIQFKPVSKKPKRVFHTRRELDMFENAKKLIGKSLSTPKPEKGVTVEKVTVQGGGPKFDKAKCLELIGRSAKKEQPSADPSTS
jgi:hypothetical protein